MPILCILFLIGRWEPESLYADGAIVCHETQTYKAHANTGALGVAAEPGDPEHVRFYVSSGTYFEVTKKIQRLGVFSSFLFHFHIISSSEANLLLAYIERRCCLTGEEHQMVASVLFVVVDFSVIGSKALPTACKVHRRVFRSRF
uniref:Uncharacterized protein n=1 Tax=Parascaris equorum TaxID=6256 RepID=A0A914R3S8_PAREQ